jgi:hypothetical protein
LFQYYVESNEIFDAAWLWLYRGITAVFILLGFLLLEKLSNTSVTSPEENKKNKSVGYLILILLCMVMVSVGFYLKIPQ